MPESSGHKSTGLFWVLIMPLHIFKIALHSTKSLALLGEASLSNVE